MYEASFVGFFKMIFVLILIYYGFKIVMKYLLPIFLKKAVSKMQQKAAEQFGNSQPNVREGETIIDKKPTKNQQSSNNVGEYIDFEEVD